MANSNSKLNELSDDTKETAQNFQEEAKEIGKSIKDNAVNIGKEVADQATGWYDSSLDYIKAHPCASVGVAFLLGVLITKLYK